MSRVQTVEIEGYGPVKIKALSKKQMTRIVHEERKGASPSELIVRRALLERRLVVGATGPETIRLLPPLTVTAEEIEEALARLSALLTTS